MNQSIFKIGLGPDDTDPLYGLLDTKENFFYAVDYRKHIIDELFEFFKIHKTTTVILISACDNWFYNKIDNSVCYNWGISAYDPAVKDRSQHCMFLVPTKNTQTGKIKILIKNLQEICRQFAGIEHCRKLTPLVTSEVLHLFDNDPWIQYAAKIEQQQHDNVQSQLSNIITKVKETIKDYSVFDKNYCDNVQQIICSLENKYNNILFKGRDL
jgi:hypothetical protein